MNGKFSWLLALDLWLLIAGLWLFITGEGTWAFWCWALGLLIWIIKKKAVKQK
jgi:hypothetical protein